MNVLNLTCGLGVEVDKLLAAWSTGCFFVVGVQTSEEGADFGSDAIGLINCLGLVGSGVLLVKTIKGG
jgi:hypothetical protein